MHEQQLVRLAEHLESGQLGHEVFDYSELNGGKDFQYAFQGCGTHGCAVGELPILFPEEWGWCGLNFPILKKGSSDNSISDASIFFDLSMSETEFLFDPAFNALGDDATRAEVAQHIRQFIKHGGIYDSDFIDKDC